LVLSSVTAKQAIIESNPLPPPKKKEHEPIREPNHQQQWRGRGNGHRRGHRIPRRIPEAAFEKEMIWFSEFHSEPRIVALLNDTILSLLESMERRQRKRGKNRRQPKLHVVMEHFSVEMQDLLDKFQTDPAFGYPELKKEYQEIGTEVRVERFCLSADRPHHIKRTFTEGVFFVSVGWSDLKIGGNSFCPLGSSLSPLIGIAHFSVCGVTGGTVEMQNNKLDRVTGWIPTEDSSCIARIPPSPSTTMVFHR
jgi:hypothetical protein